MEKIQINMVMEILGRPKEHVIDALNGIVTKLGTEKGVTLLNKNVHDPILAQDSKDLFTTFAEISLELESLENYFGILFAYMPANVEFVYPGKITFSNLELNELGNKLIARLHEYDAITKKALIEREIMAKKLYEVAPHMFKNSPEEKKDEKNLTKKEKKKEKKK